MTKLWICAVLLSLAAGCASTRSYEVHQPETVDEGSASADIAPTNRTEALRGGFTEAPLEDADLRITRAGWILVDSGEEMAASKRLRKAAAKFDATVMSFNDHSVTFKMPSARLESLLEVIETTEGWDLDEFDFSAWDRTGEFYSIEARIESTTAVKARMLKLLESAQSVEEVLSISRRLEELQSQLDAFETTMRVIKLRAGRVDVTVTFD